MPRQRTTTANLNVRVTPDQDRVLTARADRLGISLSEATRQLLDMGMLIDAAETHGVTVTRAAADLIASDAPLVLSFGLGDDGELVLHLPEDRVD